MRTHGQTNMIFQTPLHNSPFGAINSIWVQKIFACGGLKIIVFSRFWNVSNTLQTCKFVVFDRISEAKILKIFSPAASYDNALLNASNLYVDSKQVVSDQ